MMSGQFFYRKSFYGKSKRSHIDNLAKHAELAAAQGNMRELYNTTKKLSARYQLADKPIKDKEGKTLTSAEERLKRWVEHFSELLNRPAPEDRPDIPPAETELPINCGKSTRREITKGNPVCEEW